MVGIEVPNGTFPSGKLNVDLTGFSTMQQTILARIYNIRFPILQCACHKILVVLFQMPLVQSVICQIPLFIFPLARQKVLFYMVDDLVRWEYVFGIGCNKVRRARNRYVMFLAGFSWWYFKTRQKTYFTHRTHLHFLDTICHIETI